jgi:hypothetical protein
VTTVKTSAGPGGSLPRNSDPIRMYAGTTRLRFEPFGHENQKRLRHLIWVNDLQVRLCSGSIGMSFNIVMNKCIKISANNGYVGNVLDATST